MKHAIYLILAIICFYFFVNYENRKAHEELREIAIVQCEATTQILKLMSAKEKIEAMKDINAREKERKNLSKGGGKK